jgi:hypothetical protein
VPCSLVDRDRSFGGAYCSPKHGGSNFLRNVSHYLPDYSHNVPEEKTSSHLPLEPEMSLRHMYCGSHSNIYFCLNTSSNFEEWYIQSDWKREGESLLRHDNADGKEKFFIILSRWLHPAEQDGQSCRSRGERATSYTNLKGRVHKRDTSV